MDDANRNRPPWHYALAAAAIVALAAAVLLLMGRVPVSASGRVMLWGGGANSPENSQQLFDWYSFSHVIHGIAFYYLFRFATRRRWPLGALLLLAVGVEAAWEVFENTPFTIDRYRKATVALNYYGDSVLNSVSDILCCVAGFFLAATLPWWASVALVVAMELFVLFAIRDNLTLNILMLFHPSDAIRKWQQGSG
jgi:hypothetical protein